MLWSDAWNQRTNIAWLHKKAGLRPRRIPKFPNPLSQVPFVESTPVYEFGEPYARLDIPAPAKKLLSTLASLSPGVGVFERPYKHQASALEGFLGRGEDLIVA